MAAGKIKVLIGEQDGAELDPTEYLFSVDDLPFAETGDSLAVAETAGQVSTVTYYRSATQTTGNRKALATITYDGAGQPTTEVWQYFDDDGTTVKRTATLTHTWTSGALTSTVEAIT